LIDNDWFKALSTLLATVKKSSDKVSVGCQLSLTALGNGRFTRYSEAEDLKKSMYTHPNIEAKFQLFPNRFGRGTTISHIVLGAGSLSNVFNDSTTENFEVLMKDYPNSVAKPLFRSSVGNNEQFLLGKYKTLSLMVHPQIINDQIIDFEHVYINKELTPITQASTFQFPHGSISPGSFSFTLHLSSPDLNLYNDRFIYITQIYNEPLNIYDSLIHIKKPISIITGNDVADEASRLLESGMEWVDVVAACASKYNLSYAQESMLTRTGDTTVIYDSEDSGNEVIRRVLREVSSKSYSMFVNNNLFFRLEDEVEDSFMKPDPDSFILLESFSGEVDSRGNPVFASLNLLEGTLKLKLKYDIENEVGRVYGENFSTYDETPARALVSYEINSLKTGSNDQLDQETAARVGITEVGLFDAQERMIAYGTFPPIIYDSSKYHSSYNISLDTTPVIDRSLLQDDTQTNYYSFNDLPAIPSYSDCTFYKQSEWASSDGWMAGAGTKAVSKSYGDPALQIEGSGAASYHEVVKAVSAPKNALLQISVKYASEITQIRVKDGNSLIPLTLVKEGNFYLGTHSFTEDTSQLTIHIMYSSSTLAKGKISEISWVYLGRGSYAASIEDESAYTHPAVAIRTLQTSGIESVAPSFLDPYSYCVIA